MTWSAGLAEVQGAAPVVVGILAVVVSVLVAAALVGVLVGGLSRGGDDD